MAEKHWQAYMMHPKGLKECDRERLMHCADVGYDLGLYATEAEAKAAAEEALRKLKQVSDIEWTACYAEPVTESNRHNDATPRCISTSKVDATD